MNFSKILLLISFGLCSSCALHERAPEPLNEKASIQYQFAYDAFVQGNLIPALAACLKAIDLTPDNPDARNLLGLIYFRQDKYVQAEAAFKEAVAIDPKLSEGWNNLGTLYYEQKKYSEALKIFERALENPLYLYPERIYNNIGLVQEALGQKPKAIEAYAHSMSLQNEFYLPFQNLGRLYYQEGNYKKAKGLLKEASRMCENCSQPRYFLGLILLKDNQTTEALKVFKEGADTDPRGYYGQLCKQYIVKD
jgi:type IV pilus biogenesis/stability protein PilW